MIAHIQGRVAERRPDALVIDCAGVGYLVNCTSGTVSAAAENCKLHTRMVVREDSMELFGFLSREEEEMFVRLTSVTGIGPRVALNILSGLNPRELALAIMTNDERSITRAPGVGKKLAQRLILELKGKMGADDLLPGDFSATAATFSKAGAEGEAMEALMSLGYASAEAAQAIERVRGQSTETSDIVRLALKNMGGR